MLIWCSRTAVGCETSTFPDWTFDNAPGALLLTHLHLGRRPAARVPFSTFRAVLFWTHMFQPEQYPHGERRAAYASRIHCREPERDHPAVQGQGGHEVDSTAHRGGDRP